MENEKSGVLYDFPSGFYKALENSISTPKNAYVKGDFFFESIIEKWTTLLLKVNSSLSK